MNTQVQDPMYFLNKWDKNMSFQDYMEVYYSDRKKGGKKGKRKNFKKRKKAKISRPETILGAFIHIISFSLHKEPMNVGIIVPCYI